MKNGKRSKVCDFLEILVAILLSFGLVTLWAACGGRTIEHLEEPPEATTPAKTNDSVKITNVATPEWYLNPPGDPEYIYGVGTAKSRDMQMAFDIASHHARISVAKQVEVIIERAAEGTASAEDADSDIVRREVSSTNDTIVSKEMTLGGATIISKEMAKTITLRGCRQSKRYLKQEGPSFCAYVMVKMPVPAEKTAAPIVEAQKIKKSRPSQAIEELEKEWKKYEEWKKKRQES